MRRHLNLILFSALFLLPSAASGASLLGTTAALVYQNKRADEAGWIRIPNDKKLQEMKDCSELLPIPGTVRVNPELDQKWRWVLPVTAYFLGDIGLEFRERFGWEFQVNSGVRTIPRQIEISRRNLNAVPVKGPRRSLHLTGSTVDIAKIGLKPEELMWLRLKFLQLEEMGLIDATEERHQAVFHVTVFPEYEGETLRAVRQNSVQTTEP